MLSSNRLDTLQKVLQDNSCKSYCAISSVKPIGLSSTSRKAVFSALASGNDLVVSRFHRLSFSAGAAKWQVPSGTTLNGLNTVTENPKTHHVYSDIFKILKIRKLLCIPLSVARLKQISIFVSINERSLSSSVARDWCAPCVRLVPLFIDLGLKPILFQRFHNFLGKPNVW